MTSFDLQKAENILQDLPCGCVVFDQTGTITFVNRTLGSALDYQPEQIIGQSLEMILTISSRIFYQTHFFPLLKLKGKVSEIFLTLKSKSGNAIPVMANARTKTESSQPGYVCVLVPVWERQKYEEQLLEINRTQQNALQENAILNQLKNELELNQFELDRKISILTGRSQEYLQMGKVFMHDMQEPIRKLSLFFDTFLRTTGIADNTDEQRHLAVIKQSIIRLKFLVGSMLDFVQVSNAEEKVTFLNPKELIAQAREELLKDQSLADIDIQVGDLPEFEGRATQIKRVFFELLKNAAENRSDERELTVQITAIVSQENAFQYHVNKYKYTDHVRIEFADTGTGFDDRFNDYVFGLLNKLNAQSKGPGLGLALCKQIISHHYGSIRAKPVDGKGTTIVIVLPLHQLL
jgi:sigma-B regulation protein RsbU (phosphoserine phosphatase)